jgi:hypothetical protein
LARLRLIAAAIEGALGCDSREGARPEQCHLVALLDQVGAMIDRARAV